jgi:hypothetical protein
MRKHPLSKSNYSFFSSSVSFLFSPQADDCIKTYYQMEVKYYLGNFLIFFKAVKRPVFFPKTGVFGEDSNLGSFTMCVILAAKGDN